MNLKSFIKAKISRDLQDVVSLSDIVLHKISTQIEEDILSFNIDTRWVDYMNITYNEDYKEISIVIGTRDVQFNLEGDNVSSGVCLFEVDAPWEEINH